MEKTHFRLFFEGSVNFNLFKNKKTKDSQPDYRGKVQNDQGEIILDIAGWIKKTKAGDDYISVTVKEKRVEPELPEPSYEDGLPF